MLYQKSVSMLSEAKISWLNKQFRIVYQENDCKPRRRHLVGAGRLHLYIGEDNAKSCFDRAEKSKTDKTEYRLRVAGKVIFYVK